MFNPADVSQGREARPAAGIEKVRTTSPAKTTGRGFPAPAGPSVSNAEPAPLPPGRPLAPERWTARRRSHTAIRPKASSPMGPGSGISPGVCEPRVMLSRRKDTGGTCAPAFRAGTTCSSFSRPEPSTSITASIGAPCRDGQPSSRQAMSARGPRRRQPGSIPPHWYAGEDAHRAQPCPLGATLDKILGHSWIIAADVCPEGRRPGFCNTPAPVSFILKPADVRTLTHRGEKDGRISYWLLPAACGQKKFGEAWRRIGSGSV